MNPHSPSPRNEPAVASAPVEVHSERDWRLAGEVIQRALRPRLNVEDFLSRRPQLLQDGYRLVAVSCGAEMASVAGFAVSPHVEMGRELLVRDMATLPEFERRGLGRSVLEYLEGVAVAEKCGRVFVHTRKMAPFYLKNGYEEYSTGLIKRVSE